MPRKGMSWVYSPPKLPKPKVSESVKQGVAEKANALVETVLKPQHIKPPPDDERFNYLVDISTKWFRSYFYFCTTYRCPGNATVPSFEDRFARLEYRSPDRFNLSFMRHTGQWIEIYPDISLDECLVAIRDDPFFLP